MKDELKLTFICHTTPSPLEEMSTQEVQPKDSVDMVNTRKEAPVILTKEGSHDDDSDGRNELRQARTPKHANTKSYDEPLHEVSSSRHFYPSQDFSHARPRAPLQHYGAQGYPYPPNHHDTRYDQRQPPYSPAQQHRSYYSRGREILPPTVSPGNNTHRHPLYINGRDEQSRYARFEPRYGSGERLEYAYPYQYQGNHAPSHHPSHDPAYYGNVPAYPPREYPRGQIDSRISEGTTPFSRAVSSSFDRSVKSKLGDSESKVIKVKNLNDLQNRYEGPEDCNNSVAHSDDSWRQLHQVASIDEIEMRKQLEKRKAAENGRNILVNQEPSSNSSSLTNSPSNGENMAVTNATHKNEAVLPTPSKLAALDSLSSVASGQEPLKTGIEIKKSGSAPPSPGSSAGSLDLLKCHSGSSGLLHGFPHHRGMSSGSLDYSRIESMRSQEERGDEDTGVDDDIESHRVQPTLNNDREPPAKRLRVDTKREESVQIHDKPLDGVGGTLSVSPGKESQQKSQGSMRFVGRESNQNVMSPSQSSYFDRPPMYSYSLDSNPGTQRDHQGGHLASSSSSTITAVEPQIEQDVGGLSMPSWDIQPQDSFGNGSINAGAPLMSNFSFSQESNGIGFSDNRRDPHPRGYGMPPPPITETRNQSFDGGHYHGDFHRSESVDHGYPMPIPRQPMGHRNHIYPAHDNYKHPKGSFPPHPPSWSAASSSRMHLPPQTYRGPHPMYHSYHGVSQGPPAHPSYDQMHRNYSEDSGARTSPPSKLVGVGQPPHSAFQPPPEFAVPQTSHLVRRPPPAVYIMSTSGNSSDQAAMSKPRAAGIYAWTKEDDDRLTEVMKKYKNPRDWEPISKDHGRGKTAKECHERWIRYLKPGVRKGQWQDHEDAIVVEAVTTSTEQPFTRWSDLAQRLPGRVGKQIRDRWVNHLNPNINHLPFSREDDLLLWNGHKKYGKRWVEISTKFFNSNRSENHIKNRWYSASFKKFIANEFGPDAHGGDISITTKKNDVSKIKSKKLDVKSENVEL
jgi:Myb-like DNA-binding domain